MIFKLRFMFHSPAVLKKKKNLTPWQHPRLTKAESLGVGPSINIFLNYLSGLFSVAP